jgi:hypothetical protein
MRSNWFFKGSFKHRLLHSRSSTDSQTLRSKIMQEKRSSFLQHLPFALKRVITLDIFLSSCRAMHMTNPRVNSCSSKCSAQDIALKNTRGRSSIAEGGLQFYLEGLIYLHSSSVAAFKKLSCKCIARKSNAKIGGLCVQSSIQSTKIRSWLVASGW